MDKILYQACYDYAKGIKLQPKPISITKIESLVGAFYEEASHFQVVLQESNVFKFDSKLLVRAISYMAYTHANPDNDDKDVLIALFRMQLKVLIELACPNVVQTKESVAFLKDISNGIGLSMNDII
jgi:hypothetical protein